jgi:Spy/CpxP family protein refolding chaperone
MYQRLVCLVFVLATAVAASAQTLPEPPGPWWRSESVKKELGLTNDQSMRIDHIWQVAYPQLKQENTQLDEREARLSRLIETDADEAVIAHSIDRVEALRSNMNKERALMLVHMRQVLTPDQRVKFNEHVARWTEEQKARQAQQATRPGQPGAGARPPAASTAPPRPATPAPSSATPPTKRPE